MKAEFMAFKFSANEQINIYFSVHFLCLSSASFAKQLSEMKKF